MPSLAQAFLNMLIVESWVMLDSASKDFVRLPREKVLFTSPPRTSLQLQSPNSYPGKEPVNIKSNDGKATITNQRVRCFRTFLADID